MAFKKPYPMSSVFLLMMMMSSSLALDMSILSNNPNQKPNHPRSDEDVMSIFEEWLVKHNKEYSALDQKQKRFEIFKNNLNFINEHNTKVESYQLGLNQFAGLTVEEFKSKYLQADNVLLESPDVIKKPRNDVVTVPSSVDWRSQGAVTPIKDQATCGSCWIFGVNAAVEGLMKIVTKDIKSLSEQEILDCNADDYGCKGGLEKTAYDYIIKNGVTSSDNYPYGAARGECDETKRKHKVFQIDGYEQVQESESALKEAVARQPVTVAINGSSPYFIFYSEGVFTGECINGANHAVAVVGYGSTGSPDNLDYWIIKNSWGDTWGEKGYMRMHRSVPYVGGKCGITTHALYPTKNASDDLIKPD